jgi:hypothetical protein
MSKLLKVAGITAEVKIDREYGIASVKAGINGGAKEARVAQTALERDGWIVVIRGSTLEAVKYL